MGEWNPQKILDKFIHDYMIKKNMHATAEMFAQEANVDVESPVAIDTPGAFLAEWWSVFEDFYSSTPDRFSQAVAATGNVPQNFPPGMSRRPRPRQLTIGNVQPMSQRAMTALQAPSPLLTWPEMNQGIMSAMPKSMPETFANFLTGPGFGMQHGWEMQTMSSKMYMDYPVHPTGKPSAYVRRLLDVGQMTRMLPSSCKSRPPPPMSRQTIGNMQPMSQRAMNAFQAPSPLLTRPEMNQKIMSAMPNSMPETFANFPTGPGFRMQRDWEMQNMSSKMYKDYPKHPIGKQSAYVRRLLDQMTQMLPSSYKSSHQPQEILQNIQKQQSSGENQMQQISEKFQQHLERDDRPVINPKASEASVPTAGGARRDSPATSPKASKAAVPIAGGAPRAKSQKRKIADTGSSSNSSSGSGC